VAGGVAGLAKPQGEILGAGPSITCTDL
jgi:hypothetical protein